MTLGELIREYADEHSMTEFVKRSGLSRAYVYNLINNKNCSGGKITPSIKTLEKVAKGTQTTLDEILSCLGYDTVIRIEGRPLPARRKKEVIEDKHLKKLIKIAKNSHPDDIKTAIDLLKKLGDIRNK